MRVIRPYFGATLETKKEEIKKILEEPTEVKTPKEKKVKE